MASDVGGIGPHAASVVPVFRLARDSGSESDQNAAAEREVSPTAKSAQTGRALSEDEQREVAELAKRDREVRSHEQAHMAAAGSLAKGGPTYEYKRGPDGKQYATSGEVQIDSQPTSGNPEAAIAKAQQIRRAALAPADPSGQDRAVAAQAAAMERDARAKLAKKTDTTESSPTPQATQSSQPDSSRGILSCTVCGIEDDHASETHSSAIQARLQGMFASIDSSSASTSEQAMRISTLA